MLRHKCVGPFSVARTQGGKFCGACLVVAVAVIVIAGGCLCVSVPGDERVLADVGIIAEIYGKVRAPTVAENVCFVCTQPACSVCLLSARRI